MRQVNPRFDQNTFVSVIILCFGQHPSMEPDFWCGRKFLVFRAFLIKKMKQELFSLVQECRLQKHDSTILRLLGSPDSTLSHPLSQMRKYERADKSLKWLVLAEALVLPLTEYYRCTFQTTVVASF